MANKNYSVGPQDGWVKVLTVAAKSYVRISVSPPTVPFYIFGAPAATPVLGTDVGIQIPCPDLSPFETWNSTAGGNIDAFWVRVPHVSNQNATGQARIDVYTDGGTLV